jgi:hypothetical protein
MQNEELKPRGPGRPSADASDQGQKASVPYRYLAFMAMLLVALASCRADELRMADTLPDTAPPLGQVDPAAPAGQTHVDAAILRTEADSLDLHVIELRNHIMAMRQIAPAQLPTHLDQHAARVRSLAERIQQQRTNLPVPDAELPERLGMSRGEYDTMLEEVRIAGAEVNDMRGADEAAVRERLPGHLDRLERIAAQLEQGAAALRR